jgi:hypothetical protein
MKTGGVELTERALATRRRSGIGERELVEPHKGDERYQRGSEDGR